MRQIIALFILALVVAPFGARAQTWSGTVTDIRTDGAIADTSVCAGIRGRVDLTCMQSLADGSFSVTYPEDTAPGDDNLYYLYVDSPEGSLYYNQKRARAAPGEADVQLVPTNIYIKGRVVDAITGSPLNGVGVALRQPGRYDQSVISDGQGLFVFEPVFGFENWRDQYNTYGVPDEDLPPNPDDELIYDVWGVRAPYGEGSDLYAVVEPQVTVNDRYDPELSLLSSATPDIFTWVDIRLPPLETEISDPDDYITSQIGAPQGDTDIDVDTDIDADIDTDIDTDIDADGDLDGDMDGDSDGDSDGDADGDSDVDNYGTSDADGEIDSDTDSNTEQDSEDDSGSKNCSILTPGIVDRLSLFKLLLTVT